MRTVFVVALCAGVVLACDAQSLDIGRNGTPTPAPASVVDAATAISQYGCPAFLDEQMRALRGQTCDGACSDALGSPYALATQAELVAATAGQWRYCGGATLGPPDAVGIEFAPGCRIFFLVSDGTGMPARGTEATYQAAYDVYDLTGDGAPRRIDLELDARTKVAFDVRASACPNRVELTNVATGATISLESVGFGDGGRPDPIK